MDFSYLIIDWYSKNSRDLPWRRTRDPYRIWVSEIMLQQTRVDQGLGYYERFISRFGDIESLAMAQEEEVMKLWQGLGYYSRARNMHEAAKTIQRDYNSRFPASYEEIRKLKGVGDYSASAISSIAFGKTCPVIDGNVMRVVARFTGMREAVNTAGGKKKIMEYLEGQIDHDKPGTFNQAVMELGALVCKPGSPRCRECPLVDGCVAYDQGLTTDIPVISKQKRLKTRFFHYIIILNKKEGEDELWLRKRKENDIWKNLYDFPLIESERELGPDELMLEKGWEQIAGRNDLRLKNVTGAQKYLLSHRELRVKFFIVECPDFTHQEYIRVKFSDCHNYPVPRLIENILKKVAPRPGIFLKFPD
jgi:A/G-specific adenine glycosylase